MPDTLPREGLTVVITGTSSGFGKGVARKLAHAGANVVLAARRTRVIEELSEELGPNAIAVTTDISKQEDMERLYETAVSRFGRIHVWINNAAVGTIGKFTETPLQDHMRTIEINMLGTMYGSRYALSHFKEHGAGTLINMSSFVSNVAMPYGAAYTASKYAITGLSTGLYQEMKLDGFDDIHVCVVHPWVTDTPWTAHAANYSGHEINVKPMDDPETVIDAIIELIDKPQETVNIGVKTKGAMTSGNLMPETTGNMNGKILWKMIQDSPPAPKTSGSLHEPVAEGTDVSGGNRERMKKE